MFGWHQLQLIMHFLDTFQGPLSEAHGNRLIFALTSPVGLDIPLSYCTLSMPCKFNQKSEKFLKCGLILSTLMYIYVCVKSVIMQNSICSLMCTLNLALLILVGFVTTCIYPFFISYMLWQELYLQLGTSQVPTPINQQCRRFLAIKWLITAAREQQDGNARMYKKLAKELLDAYNNEVGRRFDFKCAAVYRGVVFAFLMVA